ncbi:uncharacterized protein KY384_000411 [Bacidia gigantensis]|uniref:uncharacterized protein n=1 Tax=Bacidia gigantensis TaxID=2732470 RepID=UPI001D04FF51|nr:uncharacterized protein KY384_000411 [Bacidia gigantensis]KAG8525651.1 hypothetical protein KY384_000411 [Bacidia gigantensis]
MESASATAQSMHSITTTKLAALSAKQQSYEAQKANILKSLTTTDNIRTKVKLLLDAIELHEINPPSDVSTKNIRRFLAQSHSDSAISPSTLRDWQDSLEKSLEIPSQKYEHASLFGRLVMEWLESPNETVAKNSASGSMDTDSFEHVGRKEMYEQRKEWESIVFSQNTDILASAIEDYLGKLFGSTSQAKKLLKTPLETLRESMSDFKVYRLNEDKLKSAISGILVTDLLSEPKRKALSDFKTNPLILQEIADVLNMQLSALDSWNWGKDAVDVTVRRALNGKYRVYMDEELIQAILIHHIGMSFAIHLKSCLTKFFHSGAWLQTSRQPLDAATRRFREDFGVSDGYRYDNNVRNERRSRFFNEFFLVQLPASYENTSDAYGEDNYDSKSTSPMSTKQSLLHLLNAEMVLQTRLHDSLALLQSDFRWFGPSLNHTTILTVCRFLGLPQHWLDFFEKFLKAPLRFSQDGPDAEVRTRGCGVPIQHKLSDTLGEAVLFCLDFAVNKNTKTDIHRMHDDLWFWGSPKATEGAWKTIQEFAAVMGLTLNMSKTGSAIIGKGAGGEKARTLIAGDISWGFMKLSTDGTWNLDDAQVDAHIREIRTQLAACKSIFAWVQAWNMYVTRFMSNSFGDPSNSLGRSHIDMTISAFEKIQRGVFGWQEGQIRGENVLDHLRRKLRDRFGTTDAPPDGFFYLPVDLGGLGLRNPFIPLLLVHESVQEKPVDLVERAFEHDELSYNNEKESYEAGLLGSKNEKAGVPFLSFREYMAQAEETSANLKNAYVKLLEAPVKRDVERTGLSGEKAEEIERRFDAYDEWVLELYGGEVVERYGGLAMGEKSLLPIGLVNLLKSEKIRWQG